MVEKLAEQKRKIKFLLFFGKRNDSLYYYLIFHKDQDTKRRMLKI